MTDPASVQASLELTLKDETERLTLTGCRGHLGQRALSEVPCDRAIASGAGATRDASLPPTSRDNVAILLGLVCHTKV